MAITKQQLYKTSKAIHPLAFRRSDRKMSVQVESTTKDILLDSSVNISQNEKFGAELLDESVGGEGGGIAPIMIDNSLSMINFNESTIM